MMYTYTLKSNDVHRHSKIKWCLDRMYRMITKKLINNVVYLSSYNIAYSSSVGILCAILYLKHVWCIRGSYFGVLSLLAYVFSFRHTSQFDFHIIHAHAIQCKQSILSTCNGHIITNQNSRNFTREAIFDVGRTHEQ